MEAIGGAPESSAQERDVGSAGECELSGVLVQHGHYVSRTMPARQGITVVEIATGEPRVEDSGDVAVHEGIVDEDIVGSIPAALRHRHVHGRAGRESRGPGHFREEVVNAASRVDIESQGQLVARGGGDAVSEVETGIDQSDSRHGNVVVRHGTERHATKMSALLSPRQGLKRVGHRSLTAEEWAAGFADGLASLATPPPRDAPESFEDHAIR